MKGQYVKQFRLETKLGEDGIGEVWKGVDPSTGTCIAVKVLLKEAAEIPEIVARFVSEAGGQTSLAHPNIAAARDCVYVEGRPCIVMPLIEGERLDQILFRLQAPMALEDALPICRDVLPALAYAHAQKIVHRDVKPSNIMIDRAGSAYIIDFGIAMTQSEQHLTRFGKAGGAPHYMSPEQISGSKVDERSDIYSFGCVLYEMLTGAHVFDAEGAPGDVSFQVKNRHLREVPRHPKERNTAIPEHVDTVVMRCLEKEPSRRFASCEDLLRAIQDPTWSERPEPAATIPATRVRSRGQFRVVAAIAAAALLAAGGILGYQKMFVKPPNKEVADYTPPSQPKKSPEPPQPKPPAIETLPAQTPEPPKPGPAAQARKIVHPKPPRPTKAVKSVPRAAPVPPPPPPPMETPPATASNDKPTAFGSPKRPVRYRDAVDAKAAVTVDGNILPR